jgi:hypothetical protein
MAQMSKPKKSKGGGVAEYIAKSPRAAQGHLNVGEAFVDGAGKEIGEGEHPGDEGSEEVDFSAAANAWYQGVGLVKRNLLLFAAHTFHR